MSYYGILSYFSAHILSVPLSLAAIQPQRLLNTPHVNYVNQCSMDFTTAKYKATHSNMKIVRRFVYPGPSVLVMEHMFYSR